ncbi:MAG: hypothetical protein JNK82_18405 [Myxococcaceae bacterium]|nr:hypothetical protein [Myxococcaceae bacterium]
MSVALALALCVADRAHAFDGSISTEVSYGNRTWSANLIGDWGIVPDRLYLVATYGVVRYQPEESWRSQPSHLVGLGLDVLPSSHWMLSLTGTFSPKATDTETFGPNGGLTLAHTRRNVHGLLAAGYQSAGLRDVEWGVDASLLVGWYELVRVAELPNRTFSETSDLVAVKPALGATLIVLDANEFGLRGSYTGYTKDPLQRPQLPQALLDNPLFAARAQRLGQADATAAFFSAPVWFDVRVSYLRRFGPKVTGRLAYTYIQYVPSQGNAHALSTRWAWKVTGWLRLWVGLTVQLDVPAGLSGYGTLGGELATE